MKYEKDSVVFSDLEIPYYDNNETAICTSLKWDKTMIRYISGYYNIPNSKTVVEKSTKNISNE